MLRRVAVLASKWPNGAPTFGLSLPGTLAVFADSGSGLFGLCTPMLPRSRNDQFRTRVMRSRTHIAISRRGRFDASSVLGQPARRPSLLILSASAVAR